MNGGLSPGLGVVIASTLFVSGGCAILPPDQTGVEKALSAIILDPAATCEALRDAFDVGFLPIVDNPSQIGLGYEEHWLPTGDGNAIHVWYIPARDDRGTVVLSSGASGQIACYLFTTLLLHSYGWSVTMYDYRGYGASSGEPSLATLADDLNDVVSWTRDRANRPQVTLMGISLGTIPSVAVAVRRPDAVNAVVLDSPVALAEQFDRFAPLLAWRPESYIDVLGADLVSDSIISHMTQPLLVFLDEQDIVTTPATVETLFDRAPGPKQLVRFPDLNHARGQYFATSAYVEALDSFLTANWPEAPQPSVIPVDDAGAESSE